MINLALIGAGKWGQNYLRTAGQLTDTKIKYICTKSTELKLADLLQKTDIDGVIVATPAQTHLEIAKALLAKNFNLLIEKPLTTNYPDALSLFNIWKDKQPQVLVGHLMLYNPAYQKIKELLAEIGPIQQIYFEGYSSPIRTDTSVLWDWGPHPISICLDLLKQSPTSIKATATTDTAQIILKFNQIEADIKISWLGKQKTRKLTIIGQDGKIVFDDVSNERKIQLHLFKSDKTEFPEYELTSPLYNELFSFVQAIQNKAKITSDIKFGVEVVKIISSIEDSIN